MTPVKPKKTRAKPAGKTASKPGSFEHIEAQLHALGDKRGNTAKGDAFEELCCDYLLACYPQVKEAWLWDDWPERQGADMGIDIIVKTTSGDLWAVQAKADRPDYAVKKSEINSFLAESNNSKYAFRLLIATTDRIGRNAKHTIDDQEKGVGLVLRGNLANSEIKWPTKLGKPPKKLPKKKPRKHQTSAIKNVRKGFRKHDRGQLIMACGTGKTLTALWLNEQLKSKRTLVLVPSLSLISQTFKEWNRNCKKPFEPLIVCSDQTVIKKKGADALLSSTSELGVPVTTNLGEIRAFLRKRSKRPSVVFCTYQSSDLIAEAQKSRAPAFDLALADEAHRCAGASAGLFATILDARKIKAKRRLFATATPRYFTQQVRKKAKDQDHELASMDDERQFGPVFHQLNFAEAINAGFLTDYQVVVFGVTDRETQRLAEEAALVKTEDGVETDARTLAAQIGLAKAIRKYDLKKVISFHSTVARARDFSNEDDETSFASQIAKMPRSVRPTGKFWTNHISGKTPAGMRNTLIKHFASLPSKTRGLLANCSCLGEGVDVPVLDGVAFIAPKRSPIDIIQAVGRVIRKADDKNVGTIVIPLFIDDSKDADAALSGSAFAPIWQVICALRAHDETLAEQLDRIRLDLGGLRKHRDDLLWPDKIHVDLPRNLPPGFIHKFRVRTVNTTTRRQYLSFKEARSIIRKLGLSGTKEWKLYCNGKLSDKGAKPDNIPTAPDRIYKSEGWKNWPDWLGSKHMAKGGSRPFEQARAFVHELKLSDNKEWRKYCRGEIANKPTQPIDIPTSPEAVYKGRGWAGYGDWLGTGVLGKHDRDWMPFKKAQAFVRKLKLQNESDWIRYKRGELPGKPPMPDNIPSSPARTYKNKGWKGLGDWLGTGRMAPGGALSFEQAREFVHALKLESEPEWRLYTKGELSGKPTKPMDIPANPGLVYKNKGWNGFGDWLGTGNIANANRGFRPYKEARAFVHKLNLPSLAEWKRYCQGEIPDLPPKPDDIPTNPNRTYKDRGWVGSGDWLGTGRVYGNFRPFKEAREFVQRLNLQSQVEWNLYKKGAIPGKPSKPNDIPANPSQTYKDKGWIGFGDWLGTGVIASSKKEYRPFEEAREFVRKLGLQKEEEWNLYCKGEMPGKPAKPDDIPNSPRQVYKDEGWAGSADWLGAGRIKGNFRPFEKARAFVHKLKLRKQAEWTLYCKGEIPGKPVKPTDIPASPMKAYKNKGWAGIGDWLGTGRIADRLKEWRSFEEAREFVHKLKLCTQKEWNLYCKGKMPGKPAKPDDIPNNPVGVYKDKGWAGTGDWLGTGTIAPSKRIFRPFEEARKFVRKLKLSNYTEWRNYCKGELPEKRAKPDDIPSHPSGTYKDKGWAGVGDWLGTGNIAPSKRVYLPFKEAREFVHKLELRKQAEWLLYCKGQLQGKPPKPDDIPSSPEGAYKDKGWTGIGDWLGTGNISNANRDFLPFEEARKFIRKLKLANNTEWRKYCRGKLPSKPPKPDHIPAAPWQVYKNKGWTGSRDWLGN